MYLTAVSTPPWRISKQMAVSLRSIEAAAEREYQKLFTAAKKDPIKFARQLSNE